MCGIAGFLEPGPLLPAADDIGVRMASAIARRGPDDHGVWSDSNAGIVLAHRRLAVLDLSEAGHQPMISPSGRFVIVYNGEIYNHLELRNSIQRAGHAPAWHGHSDTETLLALVDAWGLEETLRRCVGMFAFALWDRAERRLSAGTGSVRSPSTTGGSAGRCFFGSELAALRAHPSFEHRIDRAVLTESIDCRLFPARRRSTRASASFRRRAARSRQRQDGPESGQRASSPVLSLLEAAQQASADPFKGSLDDAADRLDDLLRASLSGQMLSDACRSVPFCLVVLIRR